SSSRVFRKPGNAISRCRAHSGSKMASCFSESWWVTTNAGRRGLKSSPALYGDQFFLKWKPMQAIKVDGNQMPTPSLRSDSWVYRTESSYAHHVADCGLPKRGL